MGRAKGRGGAYIVSKADSGQRTGAQISRQIDKNIWKGYDVISPPIHPKMLLETVKQNDILPQLVDAFATNVALFGWGVKYKDEFDFNKADTAAQNEATAEWNRISEIFKYFNLAYSFERVLYKAIYDMASIGYGTIEILRDGAGNICGGEYARAYNFRISGSKDDEYSEIEQARFTETGIRRIRQRKRFKKFVQDVNGEKVYFKEFGNPKILNCKTGQYDDSTPYELWATEIIFLTKHSSDSEYGDPYWIGLTPNAVGGRLSEEVNLKFFKDGKMIPFALCVNGGQLTDESIETLKSGKGLDNFFNCLLLEAKADEAEARVSGMKENRQNVDIKIQPLTDTSLKDALFQEYQKANRDKLRSSFRLPPIYLGESQDYNRSTSDTARTITEEQVFVPMRNYVADLFNIVIENELELKYVEMYLRGPKLSNSEELSNSLAPFIQGGAVTPNVLLEIFGDMMNRDIEALPDEIGNVPIELLKLQSAQANTILVPPEEVQKAYADIQDISMAIGTLEQYFGDNDDGD